jgi:mannose-6-phosphate isomerase-like protein (cupin superfamily)
MPPSLQPSLQPERFATVRLPGDSDLLAPDGSEVRILASLPHGSMAHFRLPRGQVSAAVQHLTVEEIWYVLQGHGHIWRSAPGHEQVTELSPGLSLTLPAGTAFQFRASSEGPLCIVGVTMPPWPGSDEAVPVTGKWPATVRAPQAISQATIKPAQQSK